jgi:type IV pilus assembly protein PilV
MYQYIHKIETGFTLLEVLVSLTIVSIGLLGVAGLQIRSQQYNHVGYLRTQGVFLAYDIMDRMRINPAAAKDGDYAPSPLPTTSENCDTTACNEEQLAEYDLVKWQELVKSTLLKSEVAINYTTTPNKYNIEITWQYSGNQNLQESEQSKESQQWIFRP